MKLINGYIIFLAGTIVILMVFSTELSAQDDKDPIIFDRFYNIPQNQSNIRHLLNKFALGVSTGYGKTFYKHKLDNVALIQKSTGPQLFSTASNILDDTITFAYNNWFNAVQTNTQVAIDTSDFLISADTSDLIYKSSSRGIPLMFTLHYEFEGYRVGIGASYEFHKINEFKPKTFKNELNSYQPAVQKATFKRYFGYFGANVYRYWQYSIVVDGQIGILKLGPNFDASVIKKGIYFNLGVAFEREFSEYLTAFVRTSYELKSFTTSLPEAALSVSHKQPAIFVNFGAFLRLPQLRRCRISNCEIQINHTHGGGKEWRSRSHPFYKKQNPHYGENYPKLIKYKWKNRRKLNPY